MLRLPRKTRRRQFASPVARLPPTSMKVLEVLHLPRKTSLRCSKCCACHAQRGSTHSHHPSPDFRPAIAAPATQNEREVLQVLRLPLKTRRRPFASLVAGLLPTSIEKVNMLRLPRETRRRPFASPVPRLLLTSVKVLEVLRLPRKTSLRCSKIMLC